MRYERWLPLLMAVSRALPSRHHIQDRSGLPEPRPFFVLGSGRNGSTLLGTLLNRHPDVFMAPEQYALPYAAIRFQLLNYLNWPHLVKIVIGEFSDPVNSHWGRSLAHLQPELCALPRERHSFVQILDRIYRDQAASTSRPVKIWGDKTPLNTRLFKYTWPVMKGGRFIFLLRDGRDVVSSYIKGDRKYFADHAEPKNAAKIWTQSLEVWDELQARVPANDLLLVRYEDLVHDPRKELMRICAHLNVPYDTDLLTKSDGEDTMKVQQIRDHDNVKTPVAPSSVGTWKDRMDRRTQDLVMPLLYNGLVRMGYESA